MSLVHASFISPPIAGKDYFGLFPPTHSKDHKASNKPSKSVEPLDTFDDEMIFKENGDFHEDGEENYRIKLCVLQLCANLFPELESQPTPIVKKIGQGSFNVVIGIKIQPHDRRDSGTSLGGRLTKLFGFPPKTRELALRIPLDASEELNKSPMSDVSRDVANIIVISSHLQLRIPKIVGYDLGANNALGRAYILQNRLAGQNLVSIWDDFNLDQKVSAVQQVTKMTEKIATLTVKAAGVISTENLDFPSASQIELEQFPIPTPEETKRLQENARLLGLHPRSDLSEDGNVDKVSPQQTPLELFLDLSQRWMIYERENTDRKNSDLWSALRCVAGSLSKMGWLGDRFHLVHGDLFPRNIVAIIKSPTEVEITGIVDWDMAYFAPKVVSLRAPNWAWTQNCNDGEDDCDTAEAMEPDHADLREAFRVTASAEYCKMAFAVEGAIARDLFSILRSGLCRWYRRKLAIELVRHWNKLYPLDGLIRFECVQERE